MQPGDLDRKKLAEAYLRAAQIPGMKSLLVAREGELLDETYWNGGALPCSLELVAFQS